MNNGLKRVLHAALAMILTVIFLAVPSSQIVSYALSSRISFSDPSVMVGNEVTVNMKVSSISNDVLGNANIMLSYDTNYLEFVSGTNAEGGAGSIKITGAAETDAKEWSNTLKFKALQAGETSIKVSTWEIYDNNSQMATLDKEGSSTVTITSAATSSADAKLTSLKISPGTLTPAFSADVTAYTALVGGDVDKIAVSAPTSDANAKVVISGNADLKIGENTVSCKVTAEDGTTVKTYSIVVTKQEGEVTDTATADEGVNSNEKLTINGTEYNIAKQFDETLLPEGFVASTYSYKGNEIAVGKEAEKNLMLIYLIAGDGSGDFYIYDEASDSWSQYAEISVTSKTYTVVPLDAGMSLPDGFKETTLELNGKKVRGWLWASDKEEKYCVVYAMNSTGEKNFYRYDMSEKTIQRYFEDPAIDSGMPSDDYQNVSTKYNELLKGYSIRGFILWAAGAIILILLLTVIIISRKYKSDKDYKYADDDAEGNNKYLAKHVKNADMNIDKLDDDLEEIEYIDDASREEMYLRGEDSQDEDAIIIETTVKKEETKIQQKLAKEIEDSTKEIVKDHDTDDDFETFDL